jgi:hypothetical protein
MSARVIPPLTAISPGVAVSDDEDASPLDALFTITEAQYTATSLPETPPAAYNAGTTYALGNKVSVAGANNSFVVYESLQNSNTGNTPASSPLWWKVLGTTYGVYAGGTAYVTDDRAIDATNHLEYKALANSTGAGLADTTKWQLQGPTNAWRAVDVLRNTKGTGPSGTYFTITPGKRIDAIGLAGLVADSFTLTLKVAGVTKWTYTEALSTRNTLTWSDYFFGAFLYLDVSAVFDIPKYSSADITLTFNRASGDVSIGAIWINEAVYLGETETEPNVDRRNFSTIDRRSDGSLVLIRRQTKPKNSYVVFCPKDQLSKVKPIPDELNAVPAMWVFLEDVADEYFDLVTQVGIYTRFTITPGHPDARLDIELEEA